MQRAWGYQGDLGGPTVGGGHILPQPQGPTGGQLPASPYVYLELGLKSESEEAGLRSDSCNPR